MANFVKIVDVFSSYFTSQSYREQEPYLQPLFMGPRLMTKDRPEIEQHEIVRILAKLPFFSSISQDELAAIGRVVRKKTFHKNALILDEDDTNRYMYVVVSGKVKVMRTGGDGKERIFAIHKRGDFFGEMAMLDGKTSPAAVMALEATTVGLIAKEDFDRYVMTNPRVVDKIVEMLCSRLRESWLMLKVLSCSDAEQRVRTVLGHLADTHGVTDARGTIITMKLTHKEIAGYTNLARETVSRLLTILRKEQELEVLESHQILLRKGFRRDEPIA